MKGHGEKLERKQELAIVALLREPTVGETAKATGISEITLWRWMQQPEFTERYRAARRQVLEQAIAQLQQASGEAVETLRRNLTCTVASVEVRAALAIIDQAVKGAEVLDLETRIAVLEATASETASRKGGRAWSA